MIRRRPLYCSWREDAQLHELTPRERQERQEARDRERSIPAAVRAELDALVGFEICITRELEAFDGTTYCAGMVFQAFSRIEDRLVVKLAPTREKKRSGKPKIPTTFLVLRLEWVESTGRRNGQEDEDIEEDEDDPGGDEDQDGEDGRPCDALEA